MIVYLDCVEGSVEPKDRKAVMLSSGGLDTCVVASLLNKYGFEIHHLFVDYGQNSRYKEREYAKAQCAKYGSVFHEAKIDLEWLKDSTILVADQEVDNPKVTQTLGCVEAGTYVPMRNTVLLSLAASLAESLGIQFIAAGLDGKQDVLGVPFYGSPDKHANYVKKLESALNEGSSLFHTKDKYIELIVPVLGNIKEETLAIAKECGTDLSLSWSCYNNGDKPCGTCCACVDRAEHFKNMGMTDPAL